MAADVCGTHGAFLQLIQTEAGKCEARGETAFKLPKTLQIFTKEVIAARRAIVWAASHYPGTLIRLLQDNSAAAM